MLKSWLIKRHENTYVSHIWLFLTFFFFTCIYILLISFLWIFFFCHFFYFLKQLFRQISYREISQDYRQKKGPFCRQWCCVNVSHLQKINSFGSVCLPFSYLWRLFTWLWKGYIQSKWLTLIDYCQEFQLASMWKETETNMQCKRTSVYQISKNITLYYI